MKHKYQHPAALVAQPRLYDILAASGEPDPGNDPAGPTDSDPAVPDQEW